MHNESLVASNVTTIPRVIDFEIIKYMHKLHLFQEMNGNQITFSGNFTLDDYQMVVRSLVYVNTGDELVCPLYRNITLIIEDEK